MTYSITLALECDLTEVDVEQWLAELLEEANEHLLDGEALTLQSVVLKK